MGATSQIRDSLLGKSLFIEQGTQQDGLGRRLISLIWKINILHILRMASCHPIYDSSAPPSRHEHVYASGWRCREDGSVYNLGMDTEITPLRGTRRTKRRKMTRVTETHGYTPYAQKQKKKSIRIAWCGRELSYGNNSMADRIPPL